MATITGTLATFFESSNAPDTDSIASIDIALCNYGSQVARADGTVMLADVTLKGLAVETDGTFSIELAGNDVIEPAGTYYTFTVKDGNGDTIQTNAYIFLDADTYDLNTEQPFDPSLPVPPLPPLIFDQLVDFAYQPTIGVDLDNNRTAFIFQLAGDMVVNFFIKGPPGNLYTLMVQQDATGGHQLTWADTVQNATPIDQDPNGLTAQTFISNTDGNLYPVGAGTYYP
jgi:hypothetical protein